MPNLTWSEAWTAYTAAAKLLRENFKYGSQNGSSLNFNALQELLQEALRGDVAGDAQGVLDELRGTMATLCTAHNRLLAPLIRGAAIAAGITQTGGEMIDKLYDYMIANSLSVVRRNFSRGGSFASGPGDIGLASNKHGVIFCDVDENGKAIEDGIGARTYLRVIGDQGIRKVSGVVSIRAECSGVIRDGVASSTAVPAQQFRSAVGGGRDDGNILGNPSFIATTGTHPFAPWLNSGGTYSALTSYTASGARVDPGTATQANQGGKYSALKIAASGANGSIYQKTGGVHPYTRRAPYGFFVWWRGESGHNRQVHVRHGSHEVIASAAGGAWNIIVTSGGTGLWYKNFKTTPMVFEIYLTCGVAGAGYVLVDHAWCGQLDYFNGRYFKVRTGRAEYPLDSYWTYVDSETNGLGNQAMFNKAFPGRYLPMASAGAATIADAT